MGSWQEDDPHSRSEEYPQHQLELETFYIARWPVTVAQFRVFVADTQHSRVVAPHPESIIGPNSHPAVMVVLVRRSSLLFVAHS